ncbi:hypothetical protein DEU56DRAFT_918719 [Suillus clintonianus]|uniref:uncharacterized protein n=1 Tax=Suillus clintonianus TaxID=1904413 RepID=UPI001B872A16|nr:uncharacterized protein DEU56DRAFT_918719 [Suillus clintonianus]KAG2118621.1 hypothetical protein DEU56DRAFT_918719 [Suillus clintonianus]
MRAPYASEEVAIKTQHQRKGKGTKAPARKAPTPKRKINGRQADDDDEDTSNVEDLDDVHIPTTSDTLPPHTLASFPVIVTTYEMILKDRVHLATYNWGHIVVDEGHSITIYKSRRSR